MNDRVNDQKDKDAFYSYLSKKLDAIKEENERVLARNTLLIAGGAFTLSATLLKDLYNNPLPWSRWVLIASWVVFGACAFLQIYSDHLSSLAVDVQRKNVDDYYLMDIPEAKDRQNPYDGWVRKINSMTPWLMLVGFGCMIIFSAANFLQ